MLVRIHDAVLERADRGAPVLAGVSCDIHAGEFVVLVGANGAGKSTFARAIAGLIELDAGIIHEAPGLRIGFVHQDPWSQVVGTTVADDVAFSLAAAGLQRHEIADRVAQSLETLGILDVAWRDPATLSGGQLQRVAIAGVLAAQPGLLILDEPTSYLDGAARSDLLVRVQQMTTRGVGVVWITQRADELAAATRVVGMEHGRIVYDGSPWELVQDPHAAARLGIGRPAVTTCAERLRNAGAFEGALPLSMRDLGECLGIEQATTGGPA